MIKKDINFITAAITAALTLCLLALCYALAEGGENGEDRETGFSAHHSGEGFDAWYEEFASGIQAMAGA